jgi:hypothetical protein
MNLEKVDSESSPQSKFRKMGAGLLEKNDAFGRVPVLLKGFRG